MYETIHIRSVNEIYPIVGDGLYQFLVILVVFLSTIPLVIPNYVLVFLALTPQWRTLTSKKLVSLAQSESQSLDSICKLNNSQWEWEKDIDYSVISQFGLYCGREEYLHFTTTLYFAMGAVGTTVMGYLADRFGRKVVLIVSSVLNIAIGFSSAFSVNLTMFVVLRALVGLFAFATVPLMVVYSTETVSERKRTSSSLISWVGYSTSSLLLVLTASFASSWKKLLFYTTLPYLSIVVIMLFIPETFPWLFQNEKDKEMMKYIKRILRVNRRACPQRLKFSKGYAQIGINQEEKGKFIVLFSTSKMMIKTITFASIAFISSVTCVGLTLAANDLTGNLFRDFPMIATGEIIAALISMYLASRFGRKMTSTVCFVLYGVCLIVVASTPFPTNNKAYLLVRLCNGVIGKLIGSIAYDVLATWTTESYPTFLRSTGTGFTQAFGFVGNMCAPWVGVWSKKLDGSVPFYLMGGMSILAAALTLILEETNGTKLSEYVEQKLTKKLSESQECLINNHDSEKIV